MKPESVPTSKCVMRRTQCGRKHVLNFSSKRQLRDLSLGKKHGGDLIDAILQRVGLQDPLITQPLEATSCTKNEIRKPLILGHVQFYGILNQNQLVHFSCISNSFSISNVRYFSDVRPS